MGTVVITGAPGSGVRHVATLVALQELRSGHRVGWVAAEDPIPAGLLGVEAIPAEGIIKGFDCLIIEGSNVRPNISASGASLVVRLETALPATSSRRQAPAAKSGVATTG